MMLLSVALLLSGLVGCNGSNSDSDAAANVDVYDVAPPADELEELEQLVLGGGHQPWRREPLDVAQAEFARLLDAHYADIEGISQATDVRNPLLWRLVWTEDGLRALWALRSLAVRVNLVNSRPATSDGIWYATTVHIEHSRPDVGPPAGEQFDRMRDAYWGPEGSIEREIMQVADEDFRYVQTVRDATDWPYRLVDYYFTWTTSSTPDRRHGTRKLLVYSGTNLVKSYYLHHTPEQYAIHGSTVSILLRNDQRRLLLTFMHGPPEMYRAELADSTP